MSAFQNDNFNRRRFQSTGFGLDRDVSCGDKLPAWKKKMFNSIRNKTKQHRDRLLQRLEQQRNQNQDLSPNSKKQNANNTIDSFKKSLIDHEIKQLKFNKLNMNNNGNIQQSSSNNNFNMNNNNQSNNQFNQYKNNNFGNNLNFGNNHNFGNNNNNNNLNGNSNNNGIGFGQKNNGYKQQSMHFQQDEDTLSPEQYNQIFAELSKYLEDTEFSDLRQSVVASLEEFEKDQQDAQLQEILANDDYNNPHVVYCPICQKNTMHIEYINNHQPVYGCSCGIKFQPRDKNVSIPMKMEQKNCGKDQDDDDDIDFCHKKSNGNSFKFNVENKENNWSIESDEQHGQRMLKSLKNNLNCLMNYHCQQFKCNKQLNFAVIDESGYLQAWCCQCNCNEIVI